MMLPWYVLLIAIIVGIVQIAVGVAIGRLLPIGPPGKSGAGRMTRHEARQELETVGELTRKLYTMMSDMSNDVGRQRIRVEQLTKEFNAAAEERGGDEQFKSATRDVLSGLQGVTKKLAERLSQVETELRERSAEVDQRLGEYDGDPMLGLPSRLFLEASISERIEDYRRRHTPFCLGILDMDKLGETNEQYGNAAGDRLLRTAVDAVKQVAGRTAVVARMGDDEIGVLFTNRSLAIAENKLNEARHLAAASTVAVPDGTLRPTFSFGVAEYEPREQVASLMARCDEALVAAKDAGRDRGCRHDGDECVQIAVPDSEADDSDATEDMDSCFAEIRERLKEVTTEG